MKEIKLSNSNRYVIVDDEDYEYLNRYNWSLISNRYAFGYLKLRTRSYKTRILMHRLIMNAPKGLEVDHVNGSGLDNRKANLRIVTRSENANNRPFLNSNNASGYRGIHWHTSNKAWRAAFSINGKRIIIGHFKNLTEAVEAYKNATRGVIS